MANEVGIPIALFPHPIRGDRSNFVARAGDSISEALAAAGWNVSSAMTTRIIVNGSVIPEAEWATRRLELGHRMVVRAVPRGGVGAAILAAVKLIGSFLTGQTALSIAGFGLTFTVPAWVGGFFGAGLVAAGASGLAQSDLTPDQDFGGVGGFAPSPTLAGAGNILRKGMVVPDLYGTHLIAPPFGALFFTEIAGNETFFRGLYLLSHGPVTVAETRVGEVDIDELGSGTEYQIREGRTTDDPLEIFTTQVLQQNFNSLFPVAAADESTVSSTVVKTSAELVRELIVDLSMDGLYRINENGKNRTFSYKIRLQYRNVSGGSPASFTDASTASGFTGLGGDGPANLQPAQHGNDIVIGEGFVRQPFLKSFRWAVEEGTYEVRMQRLETWAANARPGGADSSATVGSFAWTSLKGLRPTELAFDTPGIATLTARLPLTDQAGGRIEVVHALASRELRIYDPAHATAGPWDADEWTTVPYPTANPAAAFRNVFQGSSFLGVPVTDSQLDIESISEWFEYCDDEGKELHVYVDSQTTAFELARDIARSARAELIMVDGKVGVAIDKDKTDPVDVITGANANSVREYRSYAEPPHRLNLQHIASEEGYDVDGVTVVYDDGYDENNATLVETVRLLGAWTHEAAWKEGRYMMAKRRLRPRVTSVVQGPTVLGLRVGSMVYFAHPEVLAGQAPGRVKSVTTNGGGDVISATFDNKVVFQEGASYRVQFRVVDSGGPSFAAVMADVVNPVGQNEPDIETVSVTFSPAITGSLKPAAGDLFAFGEVGLEVRESLVHAVRYDSELQATIDLVDLARDIFSAETGPIPEFDPGSSLPIPPTLIGPAKPTIISIISDETAIRVTREGSLVTRALITVREGLDPNRPEVSHWQAQYRKHDTVSFPGDELLERWRTVPPVPANTDRVFVESQHLDEGFYYDFRVRALAADGRISLWTTITNHQVVGQSTPPPDPVNFRIEGNVLMWEVPFRPLDFAGFRLRYNQGANANWDQGTSLVGDYGTLEASEITGNLWPSSPFVMDSVPSGTVTLMVKGEDRSGNQSVNAGVIITNLGDPLVENVVRTTDLHAAGFPREPAANVEIKDALDDLGTWTEVDTTLSLDTEEWFEGVSSFKSTADGSDPATAWDATSSVDWSGRQVRVHVFVPVADAAMITDHDGIRILLSTQNDISDDWAEWYFGTYEGVVPGKWSTLVFTIDGIGSLAPNAVSGAFDSSDVQSYAFTHNVTNGQSGRIAQWDELSTIGGGTLETTEVEGGSGDLVTISPGDAYWGSDGDNYWGPDEDNYWDEVVYEEGIWILRLQPNPLDIPSRLYFEYNDPGVPITITYMRVDDGLFWPQDPESLFWPQDLNSFFWNQRGNGFVTWPGELEVTDDRDIFVCVKLGGGTTQGRLTQFDAVFDVADVTEQFSDFTLAAGGSRLPITKTYRAITNVLATLQGTSARSIHYLDKNPIAGPLVQALDSGGSGVSESVDATVQGY